MKKIDKASFIKGIILLVVLACFVYIFYFSNLEIDSSKKSLFFIIFAILFAGACNLPIIYKRRKK